MYRFQCRSVDLSQLSWPPTRARGALLSSRIRCWKIPTISLIWKYLFQISVRTNLDHFLDTFHHYFWKIDALWIWARCRLLLYKCQRLGRLTYVLYIRWPRAFSKKQLDSRKDLVRLFCVFLFLVGKSKPLFFFEKCFSLVKLAVGSPKSCFYPRKQRSLGSTCANLQTFLLRKRAQHVCRSVSVLKNSSFLKKLPKGVLRSFFLRHHNHHQINK